MPARHPYQLGDEPVPGYRLVKFLGRGGFGEVWKAAAPGGASVALKMIVNLSGAEGRKELRALSIVKRIQHAHLVPVTAVWLKDGDGNILDDDFAGEEDRLLNQRPATATTPTSETMVVPPGHTDPRSAELIIAMGLGHKSLFDRLQECRQQGTDGIPPPELLDYMEQAARAIDYLNSASHELGKSLVAVQHCDIKPHNILIVGTAVQVCDFGLARVRGDVRATASTGASVAYASPEVLEAEGRPSEATDQYSLAISYYELRTGALPYRETSFAKVMQAVLTGNLDLSKLPAAERAVIQQATNRNPQQRFPSSMAMVKALRRAVEAPDNATTTGSAWPKVIAAAVLLIALASGGFYYLRGRTAGLVEAGGSGRESGAGATEVAIKTGGATAATTSNSLDLKALLRDASAAWKGGDNTRASEIVNRVLAEDAKQPEALALRGRLRLASNDLDGAIADLALAREILPTKAAPAEEAQAHSARAAQFVEQKKYAEAIADFTAAEQVAAGSVNRDALAKVYLLRAADAFQAKNLDQAVADYSTLIEKFPPQAREAHLRRAECRLATGDVPGAIADADAAIALSADQPDAHFSRGVAHLAAQDAAAAVADFDRVAELAGDYLAEPARTKPAATAYHTVAQTKLAAKEIDAAIAGFERARQLDKTGELGFKSNAELARAYVERATARRAAGQLDEAIADCTRVIDEQPKFALDAYCERGACLADQKDFPKAVSDFTAAIGLDPQNDLAFSRRGRARMNLEKYEEALADLDEAIRLKGDYVDRFNRGVTLSSLGRYAEAETAFTQLIENEPGDPDVYYQRAYVEIDLRQYPQAIADLRVAKKLLTSEDPAQAEALRGDLADVQALLGWVLACQPGANRGNADEALRVAKEAGLFSDWNVPWHLDVMAAAFASSAKLFAKPEQFAEAAVWQQRAIDKATKGEAVPPLAPGRNDLLKLYQDNEPFRLPGAETEAAAESKADAPTTAADKPRPASSTNAGSRPKPAINPGQLDSEISGKLQKLPPKPPQ